MPDIQSYPKKGFRYLLRHLHSSHTIGGNGPHQQTVPHIQLINSDTILPQGLPYTQKEEGSVSICTTNSQILFLQTVTIQFFHIKSTSTFNESHFHISNFIMRKSLLLSAGIFFLILINAFSQDKAEPSFYRNQVGIQLNPVINDRLLSTGGLGLIETFSSLRYGYRITKNFTTGMEFLCKFPILTNSSYRKNSQNFNFFIYRIGLNARYSILSEKRLRLFAEVSPYFAHAYRPVLNSGDPTPYRNDEFGFYAAPGVTLYSKSRRISFDLYHELSFTGYNMLSYKINYNF